MSSIEERVRKIVVEQLGVKEEEVTLEASFVDDLGADSLDTVELVMELEEEFDINIPDDAAEKIETEYFAFLVEECAEVMDGSIGHLRVAASIGAEQRGW